MACNDAERNRLQLAQVQTENKFDFEVENRNLSLRQRRELPQKIQQIARKLMRNSFVHECFDIFGIFQ